VLFLRNQIKPIQKLARAAEAFGRGRPVKDFVPQGAREVRRAAQAFIAMRRRIERQIEQRTVMLAGVSHDLRTMLTRLRLGVAMLPPGDDADAMTHDLDDMQSMLEAYMAYARGDPDETAEPVDVAAILADAAERHGLDGATITVEVKGAPNPRLRPNGFKRLVSNVVGNAAKYGRTVAVKAETVGNFMTLTVDDDGPGIPEAAREQVFRPFVRLDDARNQNRGGAGLGLSIARDVARSHGGDVRIETSPLGGARVVARLVAADVDPAADQ
jgi:two-component system osmolarity sensor histidine kinase EnvZ